VHAPEPVMAGTVAFGDAWTWTTERLPRALFPVLDAKLPGAMPFDAPLTAPELVAHLAQRIQLQADIAPNTCGVASRDPSQRRAIVYFSCRDFTLASQSMSLAVQIVDRLITATVAPE